MKPWMNRILPLSLGAALLLSSLGGAEEQTWMSLEKRDFGHTADGKIVWQYTLKNHHGLEAKVMSYGATWTNMFVPDRNGVSGDVLLGFDQLQPYLGSHPYFGAVVGRVANRIARGKFNLDGHDYSVPVNNGPNSLHGGLKGTDKVVWESDAGQTPDGPSVHFHYVDPAGNNGYPGTIHMDVTYTLTESDQMRIAYKATTDAPTPINLTNHAYFNLGTAASGDVLDDVVQIDADRYTPVDDTQIPTGRVLPVKGTPFDFTIPTPIRENVEKVGKDPTGFDHNWVLNGPEGRERKVARVVDPESGRILEVSTDQPGLQFYTGNFLDGSNVGKGGIVYKKHQAFCMETQHFPDSINHPNFPSTVLRPGQIYRTSTVYQFSAE